MVVDLTRLGAIAHRARSRAFHRTLKLARTIADLEEMEIIRAAHVAKAIQYRPRQSV